MLMSKDEVIKKIQNDEALVLAGDQNVLQDLPKGCWIAGTIPYFMDTSGGVINQEQIFVTEIPEFVTKTEITSYSEGELPNIPKDAPENGFSFIIIPATSNVHVTYAQEAPRYEGIFLKPIIGWISGVHLDELQKKKPLVYDGKQGSTSDTHAVVMHCSLPENKIPEIGIVNLFEQGPGDTITFDESGFTVNNCYVNGEKQNFAQYLNTKGIDTRLPLVADYAGTMVNVSFQKVDNENNQVDLYAPVFRDVAYKIAKPISNYVHEFQDAVPKNISHPLFSCNCILNFLYSELEGKKLEQLYGPITFGEIAYQLLNQTLVYLEVKEV